MKANILIIYATRHGFTLKCVLLMKERLGESCDMHLLKGNDSPNPADYDTILIGGSIHTGSIQKNIRRFCTNNQKLLLERRVGLFLSCMMEGEEAQKEFDEAYPDWLREHAQAKTIVGGAFYFDRMNLMERAIIRKVAGVDKTVERFEKDKIEAFLKKITAD